MPPVSTYLCSLAMVFFITICLVLAAVRWFHMCRPYDRNPRYYYPARPYLTIIFASSLIMLPYALHPESGDAWFLVRVYFLPVTLFYFAILLLAYFGGIMEWKRWRLPTIAVGAPVGMLLIGAFILAVIPGEQLVGSVVPKAAQLLLYSAGMLLTGVCVSATVLVHRWARTLDLDDYSNLADFPEVEARRWSWMILVNLSLSWLAVLSDSRPAMAVIQVMIGINTVIFLMTVLHPHRNRPVEEPEAEEEKQQEELLYQRAVPAKKRAEILEAVRTIVEEHSAYLDPHLTLQDVSDRSGYSRTYICGLLKAEYGGFFIYVNRLRLQHVDVWLEQHPGCTVQEAAEASGFVSRQAYYKVRANLPKE